MCTAKRRKVGHTPANPGCTEMCAEAAAEMRSVGGRKDGEVAQRAIDIRCMEPPGDSTALL